MLVERFGDGVLEAGDLGVQDAYLGDEPGDDRGKDLCGDRGRGRWSGLKPLEEFGRRLPPR
jgi:hypothetical protein